MWKTRSCVGHQRDFKLFLTWGPLERQQLSQGDQCSRGGSAAFQFLANIRALPIFGPVCLNMLWYKHISLVKVGCIKHFCHFVISSFKTDFSLQIVKKCCLILTARCNFCWKVSRAAATVTVKVKPGQIVTTNNRVQTQTVGDALTPGEFSFTSSGHTL